MRLSPVVLALLPGLAASSAYAAVYQVQELPEVSTVQSQFAAAINDNGDAVGNGSFIYNFPVDVSRLDFEDASLTALLTAEEIEQVKLGNVTAAALTKLLGYLRTANNNGNYTIQRYSDVLALNLTTGAQVKIREQAAVPTNREYIYDINNSSNAIALATTPFTLQSFTPAATETTPSPETVELWVPDLGYIKSYVVNGNSVTALPIPYEELGGGFSNAVKISESNYIAGSGSVGMDETTKEAIETACKGETAPVNICYYSAAPTAYYERALVWKMNESGQISAPVEYGFLGPVIEGSSLSGYISRALSVNDDGIAVGFSTYTDAERRVSPTHATVFDEGEVSPIINPLDWDFSSANDINNQNIIVGSANKRFNGIARNRMFIFDYNTKTVTYPNGFFSSSGTLPSAINENNLVVGAAEIVPEDGTTRRQVAFLYNIQDQSFVDLNTLLPCGTKFNLVEAKDINNNNEIIANAIFSVEQRDSKGELVKDSAGNPVMENVTRPVKLTPVPNGTIEDCNVAEEVTYERQGGSSAWFSLLLLPLLMLRRRLK
ncbi:DUF3466 family protein [Rheinheimera mesophila]|uniref:DUF3466 family protein n=1 Tax=Rheinheimera mesophila TaxID=1547515 RepID=A0A3P3QNH1_9GAMM|nr:DUF3466 family protein [Rheinheimera mesophila]KKK99807.1 hypothetical protein SD53_17585 [Rheinheimera mesophila]RRJ22781.1 DUF3466 family protein [Rheinheimera mesophila]